MKRQPPNLVPLAPLSHRATWAKKPTKFDQPTATCPRCKTEIPDFDGLGVLAHVGSDGCGYCKHPSRDLDEATGLWRCGICGDTTP